RPRLRARPGARGARHRAGNGAPRRSAGDSKMKTPLEIIARAALLVLIAPPAGAVAQSTPETSSWVPPPLRAVAFEQRIGASIPRAARFLDSDGAEIELGRVLRGRPVLLVPVYFA